MPVQNDAAGLDKNTAGPTNSSTVAMPSQRCFGLELLCAPLSPGAGSSG